MFEEPCSPAMRDFRYAPTSWQQGIFDCKVFRQIVYSLTNPAASCGECARCCSSIFGRVRLFLTLT